MKAAVSSPAGGPVLVVKKLSVRLGSGAFAVEEVDFQIGQAECVALVGESGCGKSLTALSLLGAVPPEVGSTRAHGILLEGRELTALGRAELRSVRGGRISMIFQDPSAALNPLFSVGDQLVETILAHSQVSRAEALTRAKSILAEVGLDEADRRLRSYPHQLSGGQRQRVMIAIALATEPRLVIADEPTTALDVTVQFQILKLLEGLRSGRGLSLLLITHNLALVGELADRILIMYAGQIVESGPAEELLTAAAHPYTRSLLKCLPSLDRAKGKLATIPGAVPGPGQAPEGCRFRPRCVLARPGCEKEQLLKPVPGRSARLVRCWLASEGGVRDE